MFNCMDSIIFRVEFLELVIFKTRVVGGFCIALNNPTGIQTFSK